jgi:hypothetical protein
MKRAPAKVDPNILNFGLDLKALDLMGNLPTKDTIPKNKNMKKTFSTIVVTYSLIGFYWIIFIINTEV